MKYREALLAVCIGLTPVVAEAQEGAAAAEIAASSLAASLVEVIRSLPQDTPVGVYEAQLAGVLEGSGADTRVARSALLEARGAPGLPEAAVQAIDNLLNTLRFTRRLDVGATGVPSSSIGGPDFSGGGGGSDYQAD